MSERAASRSCRTLSALGIAVVEQQQRHAETDADGGQHGPGPALTAAGEGEADAQRQVGRPLAHVHTTRSMSLDLPSRTTISRSE
ncbi:hypothetical protein STENM327S_06728 [Streptomyces tendae]